MDSRCAVTPAGGAVAVRDGHGLVIQARTPRVIDVLVDALRSGAYPLRLGGEPRRSAFLPDSPGAELCGHVPVVIRGLLVRAHSIVEILPFDQEWSEVSICNGRSGELPSSGRLYDRSWSNLEAILVATGLRSRVSVSLPSGRSLAAGRTRGPRRLRPQARPPSALPSDQSR